MACGIAGAIGAGSPPAPWRWRWPASGPDHAAAGRGDHQPAAHRGAAGHGRRVRGGPPRRHGRDHVPALGPGVREARDHGPGRPDPGRGRDARPLARALRQQRPAGRPRRPTWRTGTRPTSSTSAPSSSAATSTTRMYMIPYGFYLRAMFWNKKLFEEAGLDGPPETMDDFMAASKADLASWRRQVRLLPARRPGRRQRLHHDDGQHDGRRRLFRRGRATAR